MPIPVSVPGAPLVTNNDDVARAESILAAMVQILANGTIGAVTNTPSTNFPTQSNPSPGVPLLLKEPQQQLFLRTIAHALQATVVNYASQSRVGVTKLSTDPSVATSPVALNAEEVSSIPGIPNGSNKVPRARADGLLDPLWLTGSPSPPIPGIFTANCSASDQVGDVIFISSFSSPNPDVSPVDISDYSKMPGTGIIISKASATECAVQSVGLVLGVYSGLSVGKIYFSGIGPNPKPVFPAPLPAPTVALFHQPLGVAITPTQLMLTPAYYFARIKGASV